MALEVSPVLMPAHAASINALGLVRRLAFQTALTFLVPYLVSTFPSAMTELFLAAINPRAEAEAPW